jgi:acyl carrier protein
MTDWTASASRTPELRDLLEPRVRHVVAEQLAVDERALGDSISIRDDLAADSLDLLELTLLLEREFRVSIPDGDLETMRSYRDVVDMVVRLVAVHDAPSPRIRAQLKMPAHAATASRHWAGPLTSIDLVVPRDADEPRRDVRHRMVR